MLATKTWSPFISRTTSHSFDFSAATMSEISSRPGYDVSLGATKNLNASTKGNYVEKSLLSIVVGVALLIIGGILMRSHVRVWNGQKNDSSLEPFDRKHLFARYRRRMQTSGIILLLGVLIPLGAAAFPVVGFFNQRPLLLTLYWLAVLFFSLWVIVLGMGDCVATGAHSRAALSRVRKKQRDLQEQVAKLKNRDSNGHH